MYHNATFVSLIRNLVSLIRTLVSLIRTAWSVVTQFVRFLRQARHVGPSCCLQRDSHLRPALAGTHPPSGIPPHRPALPPLPGTTSRSNGPGVRASRFREDWSLLARLLLFLFYWFQIRIIFYMKVAFNWFDKAKFLWSTSEHVCELNFSAN